MNNFYKELALLAVIGMASNAHSTNVVSNPAEDSTAEYFSSFTLTFPDYVRVMPNSPMYDILNGPCTFTNVATGEVASLGGGLPSPLMNNTLFLELNTDVFTVEWLSKAGQENSSETFKTFPHGVYELVIPQGMISLYDADGNESQNDEIIMRFNLKSFSQSNVSITCDVEDCEIWESSNLKFNGEYSEVVLNPDCRGNVSLVDRRGMSMEVATLGLEMTAGGARVFLPEAWKVPGPYSISIPEGYFLFDGKASRGYNFNFNVEGRESDRQIVVTPTPGEHVESLEQVEIQYLYYTNVMFDASLADEDESMAYFSDPDGKSKVYATFSYSPEKNNTFVVNPISYFAGDGTWQLVIPARSITANGEKNAEPIVYSWKMGNATDNVSEIGTVEEKTIYDLTGRKIKDSSKDLEGIEKGIYIVSGKKIIK